MEVSSMVHICIQKVLQGTGNMIAPMWFQIAGVLLNFVLDPLLIFGVWIFPEMGDRRSCGIYCVRIYILDDPGILCADFP